MVSAIREYFAEFIKRNGKEITIYSYSRSYSTYYDTATTTYTESSSTYGLVIPESIKKSSEQEGNILGSSLLMLIPYNITIDNEYKITYNGTDYKVKSVDDYQYQGNTVAKQVNITRIDND